MILRGVGDTLTETGRAAYCSDISTSTRISTSSTVFALQIKSCKYCWSFLCSVPITDGRIAHVLLLYTALPWECPANHRGFTGGSRLTCEDGNASNFRKGTAVYVL